MIQIENYEIHLQKEHPHTHLSIEKGGTTLHQFNIFSKYTEKVLSVIRENRGLIGGPKQINLFDRVSLSDCIKEKWLWKPLESNSMDFEQSVEHFLKHVKNIPLSGAKVSDEELLVWLEKHTSLSSSLNDNTQVVNLSKIINGMRKQFKIDKVDALDLDAFIAMSGEAFLKASMGTSDLDFRDIAFSCKNADSFREKIFALCPGISFAKEECCGIEKDGFLSTYSSTSQSPILKISYSGVCMKYKNLLDKSHPIKNKLLLSLDDSVFWEDVWYELYRLKEEEMLHSSKAELERLRNKMKHLLSLDVSDESGVLSSEKISELYLLKYGEKLSAQTMRNYLKKGLGIMKKYIEDSPLTLEDYLCA